MEAYVGIDWDRKKAVAAVSHHTGITKRIAKPIAPTKAAVNAFLQRVKRWNPEADSIRVAIEAGHPRWARIFHSLGAIVHIIDAKQARRFAESLSSSGAKDDHRDAATLLLIAQSPPHRRAPWCPPDARSAALLQLVQAHQQHTKELTRVRNRLRALLAEHWPALDEVVTTLSVRWFQTLLRALPTPRQAQALRRSAYEELVRGSGMHASTRERVWTALKATEVLLEPAESESLELIIELLVEQLSSGQARLSRLEASMDARMKEMPSAVVLRSVSGIGLKLGAGLLSLCFSGRISGGRDSASIRLGASPVSRHSGQMKKAHVHLRRSSGPLQQRLSYLLGLQATQRLSWARAMYMAGRKRGQSAGTAFRRVSRSLLRILTAMLRDGEVYDEARYIRALKDKGVPWAEDLKIPDAA